mgnify:CR=1 FL=1
MQAILSAKPSLQAKARDDIARTQEALKVIDKVRLYKEEERTNITKLIEHRFRQSQQHQKKHRPSLHSRNFRKKVKEALKDKQNEPDP